jgi:GntR family transcriptional repressor for pyruvate dehydrogenase complex
LTSVLIICHIGNMKTRLSDKYRLSKPTRLPDQIASILMNEMEKGVLKPNEMLPTEAELSKKFGVSRAVVREALSQLKYEGLLAPHQGKGVTVVGAKGRRFFHLEELSKQSHQELIQFFELRAILESAAAAKAAERRSKVDLASLRACVNEMSQAVDDDKIGSQPDLAFHKGIAEAAGNVHLKNLMQFLNDKLLLTIEKARNNTRLKPGLSNEVQKEHEAIFKAIEAKDPEGARIASLAHLANAAKRLGLRIPD